MLETDGMDINFKVIATQQPVFYNNGMDEGYYEISFRADASHGYAPKTNINKDLIGVSPTSSSRNFTIQNLSNCKKRYYPIIEVELGDTETSFKIENLSNGYAMEFTSLSGGEKLYGEKLYIDGTNDIIVSSLDLNRLPNLTNLEFFNLSYGSNNIKVTGDVDIKFIVEYPIVI